MTVTRSGCDGAPVARAWHRETHETSDTHSVMTLKVDDGCGVEHTPQMYEAWMMGHSTQSGSETGAVGYDDDDTLTTGDDA